MEAANEAVVKTLERDVLHPDVTDTVVRKALDRFRASQQESAKRRQRFHQQITAVDTELRRFMAAISAGGDIPALVDAVKECNDRRTVLSERLAELDRSQQLNQTDYDELKLELRNHFRKTWLIIMSRQITVTRQILGKLSNGNRLPFNPVSDKSGSQYEFNRTASIGRLLTGRAKEVVSPTGIITPRSTLSALPSTCWWKPHEPIRHDRHPSFETVPKRGSLLPRHRGRKEPIRCLSQGIQTSAS